MSYADFHIETTAHSSGVGDSLPVSSSGHRVPAAKMKDRPPAPPQGRSRAVALPSNQPQPSPNRRYFPSRTVVGQSGGRVLPAIRDTMHVNHLLRQVGLARGCGDTLHATPYRAARSPRQFEIEHRIEHPRLRQLSVHDLLMVT